MKKRILVPSILIASLLFSGCGAPKASNAGEVSIVFPERLYEFLSIEDLDELRNPEGNIVSETDEGGYVHVSTSQETLDKLKANLLADLQALATTDINLYPGVVELSNNEELTKFTVKSKADIDQETMLTYAYNLVYLGATYQVYNGDSSVPVITVEFVNAENGEVINNIERQEPQAFFEEIRSILGDTVSEEDPAAEEVAK